MTTEERAAKAQEITDDTERIAQFDMLQNEIGRLQTIKGTVYKINIVGDGENAWATTDADIVAKAELAVDKLITAKLAEQAAV